MIEAKNLQKIIDQNTVINIDELKISPGEITALVGPAGSGKKILLDLLTGKIQPSLGAIEVCGFNPRTHRREVSTRTGILFEEDSIYLHRSPRQNLSFHCSLRGVPKTRVDEVISMIGLADQADTQAEKLSGGLLRRLAFGIAILHKPEVIIAIEPFERCDQESISLISRLMESWSGEGATILVLSSESSHLNLLCDQIYILQNGQITDRLSPKEEQDDHFSLKVPVRQEGRVVLVNPSDILYADAHEGRAILHTLDARLPTHFTLSELEDRLVRSGFFRAHRSYLVNLQHVREVIPYTRNSFSLRLNDPATTEIPLSKSAASELRDIFGY